MFRELKLRLVHSRFLFIVMFPLICELSHVVALWDTRSGNMNDEGLRGHGVGRVSYNGFTFDCCSSLFVCSFVMTPVVNVYIKKGSNSLVPLLLTNTKRSRTITLFRRKYRQLINVLGQS